MKALKRTPLSQAIMGVLMLSLSPALLAAETDQIDTKKKTDTKADAQVLPEVAVTDSLSPREKQKQKPSFVEKYKLPVTTESVTRAEIDERVNMISAEDAIKYEPSLFVRKRWQGEVNAPLQTRTATASQSARTMIYADGILLSNYMGNNNSNTGSPRWNTVSPAEIERYDMLYGPYSAQYAGNSMGGVLNITTKMPTKFEAGADMQGSWGSYNVYNHKGDTNSQNYSAYVGDRVGDWAFRFDFNHIDAINQPIAFATTALTTAAQVASVNAAAAAGNLQGATLSANSYGVPMLVTAATNIYNTHQDNFKWRLSYDITSSIKASYTLGMWQNSQTSTFNNYLPNASGTYSLGATGTGLTPVTINQTSSPLTLGDIAQTTFSHGMALKQDTGGKFDWELTGSVVDLSDDNSRVSTVSNAQLAAGTLSGRNTVLTGSNWNNIDAKGIWRPGDFYGNHEVSFGYHIDNYQMLNPVYNLTNWSQGSPALTAYSLASGQQQNIYYSNSEGKTQTQGYWLQDSWDFAKEWNATVGGRLESWSATDGLNQAWTGASTTGNSSSWRTINQDNHNALNFSPKGKVTWNPNESWRFGGAVGQSYRYPTAAELFQTTTTGSGASAQIINGNPNLLPERALSSELSAEYFLPKGKMRISAFQEKVNNAIYSVATLLSNGAVASQNYNVGQTDTYGLEFSGEAKDVLIDTLNLYGSATWTDARTTDNSAADRAIAMQTLSASNPGQNWPTTGAMLPRIPTYRATWTVSYQPVKNLTTSVSGRYMKATFSQLNNSDVNHNTYIGNSDMFVVDLKANYKFDQHWSLNAGIDNVNNQLYWVFHPFPMRTYVAQIKYAW